MSNGAAPSFEVTREIRDACLCLHLQRAARVVARRFDAALRPLGLTSGQFSLLMSLNRPAPARRAEVAALLAMDRTTLTANLKPLQRRGLVTVTADTADRRSHLLNLTSAGADLLTAAVPVWRDTHGAIEARLAATAAAMRAGLHLLGAGAAGVSADFGRVDPAVPRRLQRKPA